MNISREQLVKILGGLEIITDSVREILGQVPTEAPTNVVNNVVNIDTKKKDTKEDKKEETKEVDLESLSFNDIKAMCKEHGIPVKGSKASLIEKLREVLNSTEEDTQDEEVQPEEPTEVETKENVDVEEDAPVDTDVEPIEGNELEDQLNEMTVEELSDILSSVGITPKGKKQALVAKVLQAVEEGLIELEGAEEEDDVEGDVEVEPTQDPETEAEETEIDTEELEALLTDLDVKTLKAVCKELDIKISLKDKQDSLLEKIANKDVEDIVNALIALELIEDPDADEDVEEDEDLTDNLYTPVGTPARQEKVLALFEAYKAEYDEGSVSDKEVLDFLKDYYNENPNELNTKLPKEELALEYAWIHANLVDDEGEEVDFGEPYEVDGEYWSCSKKLKELDNGDMYCTVTGETYEAE